MRCKKAIIIHQCTKARVLEAPLKAGQDLRQAEVLQAAKKDFHRMYYGWYRGLKKLGYQVVLLDRPSYIIPDFLVHLSPELYVGAIKTLGHRLAFPLRMVDSVFLNLHILFLILTFRPDLLLFAYDSISRALNLICRRRGIRTVSYFGIPPSLARHGLKERVAGFDWILSGYELHRLWPEVQGRYYRILLGPSEDSKYMENCGCEKDIDVCLIGSFDGKLFRTRSVIVNELLHRLRDDEIEIRVYGAGNNLGTEFPHLRQALRGALYGDRFYETIKRSKILLTIPNDDHIRAGVTRPQGIMEAAASGTFQIVYDSEDARSIFEAKSEIVLFDNIDDLVEKIKYYLEHEQERESMAQRAFTKFLGTYTGEKQIARLVESLGL